MSTKTRMVPLLCAAALCAGCASAADEPAWESEEDTAEARAAIEKNNSDEMNGTELNGDFLNGVRPNGVRPNGVRPNGVRPNGIGLEATDPDTGLVVSSTGFIGAEVDGVLGNNSPITVIISNVVEDDLPGIDTYEITYNGGNICGSTGAKALIMPGRWDYLTGAYVDDPEMYTVACRGAAIAKCAEWGYPDGGHWTEHNGGSSQNISMKYFHQACVRMVRADYCGDGRSHTQNGTLIDVYDAAGIQLPTPGGTLPFEAEWTAEGAKCIKHARWATGMYGNVESYIKGHPSCEWRWAGADRTAAHNACGASTWADFTTNGYNEDPDTRAFLRNKSAQH